MEWQHNICGTSSKSSPGARMFKKQPMAWQITTFRQRSGQPEAIRARARELLESPIVFFSSLLRPARQGERPLPRYHQRGSFVFADAVRRNPIAPDFDKDFRQLARTLPGRRDEAVGPAASLCRESTFPSPADFPWRINRGCKNARSTVRISGYWEAGVQIRKEPQGFRDGRQRHRLRHGLEPRRVQKLDSGEIRRRETAINGYFKTPLARNGEWLPQKPPHNLMVEANKAGLDVVWSQRRSFRPTRTSMIIVFLYMQPQRHFL